MLLSSLYTLTFSASYHDEEQLNIVDLRELLITLSFIAKPSNVQYCRLHADFALIIGFTRTGWRSRRAEPASVYRLPANGEAGMNGITNVVCGQEFAKKKECRRIMKKQKDLNILFIFADQMHAFAMGCMGNPDVKTPRLDELASRGILFANTYSCYPVCTPYRGVLFTGKYGSQTGVRKNNNALPNDGTTLAQDLNEGGYCTSYVGKWHLGATGNIAVDPELRGGFQQFSGYQCYNDYLREVWFFDEEGNKTEYHRHRTDVTTDIALEKLRNLKDSKFALFVSYQNPHYPVQPSKQYADLYKGVNITRRMNALSIDPYTKTLSPPTPNHEMDMNYLRYGSDLDEYLRLYYAMITQLDDNIGRIMDALMELGLADNTVVIFTADHGDMQGSHGLKNKNVFWEESTHVPLILRVPGGKQGVTMNELISTVDFYPTILDYGSISVPKEKEGASFVPMTYGEEQPWKNEVFSEDARWYMCRSGCFKLVIDSTTLEPTHLFDLQADPYEMKNLVTEQIPQKEILMQKLIEWRKKIEQEGGRNFGTITG